MNSENNSFLITISGPSGVGKTVLSQKMIELNKSNLSFSISSTTRNKRENEVNGVDYNFISKEEFKKRIEENKFAEYVESFGGNYYGTEKDQIYTNISNNKSIIFDIDARGVLQIQENIKLTMLKIFILPPSYEELKKRLINRNKENETLIKERLDRFKIEIQDLSIYDYILINDEFDTCLTNLLQIYNVFKLKLNTKNINKNYAI
jgi:guanylate kinase